MEHLDLKLLTVKLLQALREYAKETKTPFDDLIVEIIAGLIGKVVK